MVLKNNYIPLLFIWVFICTQHGMHAEVENNCGAVLSLCLPVCCRDQTQVARLVQLVPLATEPSYWSRQASLLYGGAVSFLGGAKGGNSQETTDSLVRGWKEGGGQLWD